MKDLRIIIVSWNVEKLLERCLKSLSDACHGLSWECAVVDNASSDGSVETARHVAADDLRIRLIENAENVGFGRACNQGALGSDARYLLFLNPDTYCHPDSLARFVRLADERPNAGIFGPKLVFPDGRAQASVRRFPDVWSQVSPRLRSFQRYFARDVAPDEEQSVDQVMGACFLVRRECWNDIGPFDERFFIWFEEVDRCKTAISKGWEVRYLPQIQIIHHGGESFAQVFSPKKQGYYNESLIAYFKKWHQGWRVLALKFLAFAALVEAWTIEILRRPIVAWSLFVVALELVSALTIFHPVANSIATFALGVAVMLLAWKKQVVALGVLLVELLIGSKGQLLQFGEWPVTISLRIVITAMFLLGWTIAVIQKRRLKEVLNLFRGRTPYLLLAALVVYAFLRGWSLGNGARVIQDGNAWLDLFLLIPILDIATMYRAHIRRALVPVFFVGVFWLAFKTLGLEYLFSHGFKSLSPSAYLWVRRTGVGEVTLVTGNAFRIFMQSYVYATAAWILAVSYWFCQRRSKRTSLSKLERYAMGSWFVMLAATFILAISLSRSFWIGTFVGGATLIFLLSRERVRWWKRLWGPISAKLAALLLVGVILIFPIPPVKITSSFDLFGSRTNFGEAAAVSRWNLFPVLIQKIGHHPILGSGFGATVTYETNDPRILKEYSNGRYTTYAFEWGWLEHWVKFGILGIPAMLWILLSMGRRLWKSDESLWFRAGVVSSLVALGSLHIFTPYLNHPLGFLFIFVGEAIIVLNNART